MVRPRRAVQCALIFLTAGLAIAATPPLPAGQLDLDVIFADGAAGKAPSRLEWAPDGRRLGYLWDEGGEDGPGEGLWILDTDSGVARTLLRTEDLKVKDYAWSTDGSELLIESEEAAQVVRVRDGHASGLTDDGLEEDAKLSPDGRSVAFVRDYDLHLFDRESGVERALTTSGEKNETLNGITDWVYWEELWNRNSTGFWWSPDSSRIAYYQFDETPVPLYPLVNYLPTYPEVEWQRYPKAGAALPIVRVGALDVASGETVWMETAAPSEHYFPRVHWSPDGSRLILSQLNRDQNALELLSCDPATGACTIWMSESWPTWINLHDDFRWLPDGGFLWSSQKSGFRALYLHDASGRETRRLSPEGLAVGAVRAFNGDQGWVLYDAFTIGPLGAKDRAVYRQALDSVEAVALSPTSGNHQVNASDVSGRFVLSASDAATPTRRTLHEANGEVLAATLPSTALEGYAPEALPRWDFVTLPGPAGTELPAALLKPADFDPARRYPAIMYHYGCPSSQVVTDTWSGSARGLWHKMMAQRGYVVLKVDNGASNFFGKHGEDRAYRSFGPGNVAAQLAGVEYLRNLGYVDTERIGLWGWSGGGYNTLYALTHAPGVWRAGIAGAPVSDWKFYDAIWTERYMDTPEDNPEGYATASALDSAADLEDALLIVHGTADDNVHPQNTLAMSARLIEANKPFEQAIHPRQKHGFRGDDSRHFYERMTEFFERQLGLPTAAQEPEVAAPAPLGAQ